MAVEWRAYDTPEIEQINTMYLPRSGEGDNLASQLVTAINKLVYKWYNDGDVYDNHGVLRGWANDLSSYANWIYKNVPRARNILDSIFDCNNDSDYEDLLWELTKLTMNLEDLEQLASKDKVGSIYDCTGPFAFGERYDDEDYDDDYYEDEEDDDDYEDVESSTSVTAASESENEALVEQLRNLKDDFDFVISGIEKLDRSSAENSKIALEISKKFSDAVQETISAISERF